jgi:hypothetical protein
MVMHFLGHHVSILEVFPNKMLSQTMDFTMGTRRLSFHS